MAQQHGGDLTANACIASFCSPFTCVRDRSATLDSKKVWTGRVASSEKQRAKPPLHEIHMTCFFQSKSDREYVL